MADSHDGGFVDFFQRYARTWVHAVSTAVLTLFGTLTFIDRWFAAVAVAGYVLPPVVLYATGTLPGTPDERGESEADEETSDAPGSVDGESGGTVAPEPTDGTDDAPAGWTTVRTPTDATLFDATLTEAGAFAVGADGIVLSRDGENWAVELADGPGAEGRDLRSVDAVGDAVWVAGDGGALGRLDASSGRHVDYSAPADRTDAWTDIAVAGTVDDATLLLVNGSGEVFCGRSRDGDLIWEPPVKPGSGSSLVGATLVDSEVGYLCDSNDTVFQTVDGGASFEAVDIAGADGTATDIAATACGAAVTFDDGTVRTYAEGTWTPTRPSETPLVALALHDERALACSTDGAVHERPAPGANWDRRKVVDVPLSGVATGPVRSVVVGADGTVAERPSSED